MLILLICCTIPHVNSFRILFLRIIVNVLTGDIFKGASLAYYGIDNRLKLCQATVMFGRKCSVTIGATMFTLCKVAMHEL